MKSDDIKGFLYLGGAVLGAYLVYRAVTGVSNAAGAAVGALGDAAKAADKAFAGGVGAVGGWFGLPTPDETIDDPAVVRHIIDTEGSYEASKRGTAIAYIRALSMPAGSGHPMVSVFTPDEITRITSAPMLYTPGINPSGDLLAGPTFDDVSNGRWNYY
jgi:hypothetical protein